jgi:4a-hydroxytetrahydrobiopterin dehydratase
VSNLLSNAEVSAALEELSGWSGDGSAFTRTVEAPDFSTGIRMLVDVAEVAEGMNHHPDIDIRWRKVTFTLSTHSAGGVTGKDVELARRLDVIAGEHGAT